MPQPERTRIHTTQDGSRIYRRAGAVDEGLRAYMLRVYNFMGVGIALTGLSAWMSARTGVSLWLAQSGLVLVPAIASLGVVFYLSARIHKMQTRTAQLVFFGYAALMGVMFGSVFLAYTAESVTRVFFITAAAFGALSLYGYTTKRDLSPMRSFFMIALVGLIIGLVVNMFLQSSMFQFALSGAGVLLFAGLTAYDTQQIKNMYYNVASAQFGGIGGRFGTRGVDTTRLAQDTAHDKLAIIGALKLYLDFIHLFIYLLYFLGNRR